MTQISSSNYSYLSQHTHHKLTDTSYSQTELYLSNYNFTSITNRSIIRTLYTGHRFYSIAAHSFIKILSTNHQYYLSFLSTSTVHPINPPTSCYSSFHLATYFYISSTLSDSIYSICIDAATKYRVYLGCFLDYHFHAISTILTNPFPPISLYLVFKWYMPYSSPIQEQCCQLAISFIEFFQASPLYTIHSFHHIHHHSPLKDQSHLTFSSPFLTTSFIYILIVLIDSNSIRGAIFHIILTICMCLLYSTLSVFFCVCSFPRSLTLSTPNNIPSHPILICAQSFLLPFLILILFISNMLLQQFIR